MFYPSDPARCRRLAGELVAGVPQAGHSDADPLRSAGSPLRWTGAVVPHAGWAASGAIAGQAVGTLAAATKEAPPQVVVVFGAVHSPIDLPLAALDSHARWAVPGGESAVSVELGTWLAERSELFAVDDRLHDHEHAVEVELPLIQARWPDAEVLPVEVPLIDDAPEIGSRVARLVAATGLRAVFLASSDLTHYGPAYRFAPAGVGEQGLAWAKDNDRRLLDRVVGLRVGEIVPEVRMRANACGGGAIAAMLSACVELGATRATVLRHANSYETLAGLSPQPPTDAVGYAAVVVG